MDPEIREPEALTADASEYSLDAQYLAEVLHSLSNELLAARDATAKSGGGFGLLVQSAVVELDLAFTNERAGKADAGVKVYVLQAGVGGSLWRDQTTGHRITLTLIPDRELSTTRRRTHRRPGPGLDLLRFLEHHFEANGSGRAPSIHQ